MGSSGDSILNSKSMINPVYCPQNYLVPRGDLKQNFSEFGDEIYFTFPNYDQVNCLFSFSKNSVNFWFGLTRAQAWHCTCPPLEAQLPGYL